MKNNLIDFKLIIVSILLVLLSACGNSEWNNPYPKQDSGKNILYSLFSERPKHLDPVRSYSSNEYVFIGQIYEPPLQYHYLKRPYDLIPLTAKEVPEAVLYDKDGNQLPADTPAKDVDHSVYTIKIKSGIQFQPHPAFVPDGNGGYLYHNLTEKELDDIHELNDFASVSYRELTAADFLYQIKRIAQPSLHSPIFGIMAEYIEGLLELAKEIKKVEIKLQEGEVKNAFINLNDFDLSGVKIIDRYTYQIKVKGLYPQLVYWLAMPFFAPMPIEALQFYAQDGLADKNISLDWYPVGTGAYTLAVNNPNLQMVLEKNPNYREVFYPSEGASGDEEKGLLNDAGKKLPFIEKVIFNLEKESIPIWNKFLQGYYDASGVSSDSFDQAIQFGSGGEAKLTDDMIDKGIRLSTSVRTSISYMGFNMHDKLIGGLSDRARKLRQAIAIAVNYEEYISIFANGRGIPAQGPIPPGIFGHIEGEEGINPYVYNWVNGKAKRKSIEEAKKLMVAAGYKDGIDQKTGKQLVLNFDTMGSGPDSKSVFNWYRKQYKKIDIQLNVKNTDYNRFQEKMHKGTAQIFSWGWNADYPDPENFLFLLYGPNSKVKLNGENAANYNNPEFDELFEKMKSMPNNEARQKVINRMVDLVRKDSPWLFGSHPKQFSLLHKWYLNSKPNLMSHNTTQYKRINAPEREMLRSQWNNPIVWPVIFVFIILVIGTVPAYMTYRRKEHMAASKRELS